MQTQQVVNEAEVAENEVATDFYSQRGLGALADAQFAVRIPGERLPSEVRQGRTLPPLTDAGKVISGLRKTFQKFISAQIEDAGKGATNSTGLGFGNPGFDEVSAVPLVHSARKALRELTELYDTLSDGSPTTLPQRDAIIEAQALLQQFLFDFGAFAPDGTLDRRSLPDAVSYCIATSKGLGKLSLGCDAIKLQMLAALAG